MMVRMPCGPHRISLKKLRSETQTIGLISTPATGGISLRVGLSSGSVGMATMFHGGSLRSYVGNHERTTRSKKKMVPMDRRGLSTSFVGAIQGAAAAEAGSTLESSTAPARSAKASPLRRAGSEEAVNGGGGVTGATIGAHDRSAGVPTRRAELASGSASAMARRRVLAPYLCNPHTSRNLAFSLSGCFTRVTMIQISWGTMT